MVIVTFEPLVLKILKVEGLVLFTPSSETPVTGTVITLPLPLMVNDLLIEMAAVIVMLFWISIISTTELLEFVTAVVNSL